MRILVCGAGTLGGNLVEHLARRYSELTLSVLDFDVVEPKNLANQPYFNHQVNKPKVTSLAENVFRINGSRLATQNKTLSPGNAKKHLADHDLVIDCFDNFAARQAVQQGARELKLPCLHLGLAADYAEVVWDEKYRVPADGKQDPCAEPLSRTLALLGIALFDQVFSAYQKNGEKRNLCITAQDLCVSCPVP